MSFLARNVRAVARRNAAPLRRYAHSTSIELAPKSSVMESSAYLKELADVEHHAVETTDLWRKISLYVCIPGIIVCTAWVYNVESEHIAHQEHLKAENDGHLPEPPAYEYLNRRAKPFPWGANTLFFNPHVNKDMSEAE